MGRSAGVALTLWRPQVTCTSSLQDGLPLWLVELGESFTRLRTLDFVGKGVEGGWGHEGGQTGGWVRVQGERTRPESGPGPAPWGQGGGDRQSQGSGIKKDRAGD